jgi:peptide-methionine (S)-S-oxide reductase
VEYDPAIVSYDELVEYHWRHIDPLDPDGQFCDKGAAYRTAFFVETDEERAIAEVSKAELEAGDTLAGPVVTKILDQKVFWPAEDYHQNYYKKNPGRYGFYRSRCGRDARVKQVWADTPPVEFNVSDH